MKTYIMNSENIPLKIVSNPSYYGTYQKQWVMNAQGMELQVMLGDFLTELDEYNQVADDNDDEEMAAYFEREFIDIEKMYIKVKNKKNLSFAQRDRIRSQMKFNVKLIMEYFN